MRVNLSKQWLNSCLRDNSGNFATMFALLAVPAMLAVGMGVDFSRTFNNKANAQDAADSAALALVKMNSLSDKELNEQAQEYFLSNFEEATNLEKFKVKATRLSNETISVAVQGILNTTFLKVGRFPDMSFAVKSKATATMGQSDVACLHSLNPNSSKALIYNNKRGPLQFTGDSIIAPECGVQVNSNSSSALFIKEDEGYQFLEHCIVGGVDGTISEISPAPDASCKTPIPDPLAARPLPAKSGCISGGITSTNGTVTVQPGNYCGGISVNADRVEFAPGVFHVSGGDVTVTADDQVSGNEVSFVMHPGSGSIKIVTKGHLDLKAKSNGPTAGFLIFDRNNNNTSHLIKTNKNDISSMALDGFIYAPEDHVEIFWKRAGVGASEKPLYFDGFGVIADTIDLHGYNQLFIDAADLSKVIPELATGGGNPVSARLVE